MTVEIILIVVGVIFLIGSCFVQEKLSEKDVEQISKLSEEEIRIILEKKIGGAKVQIDEAIGNAIEFSKEETRREMEKESNEKIMAIDEYSDTVLEAMNKTHNEIMFLYSMLNDKQNDITELVNTIQSLSKKLKTEPETPKRTVAPLPVNSMTNVTSNKVQQPSVKNVPKTRVSQPHVATPTSNNEQMLDQMMNQIQNGASEPQISQEKTLNGNQNVRILQLHRSGMSDVAIAKELNCGLGEVRLVLGLYKGDNNSES